MTRTAESRPGGQAGTAPRSQQAATATRGECTPAPRQCPVPGCPWRGVCPVHDGPEPDRHDEDIDNLMREPVAGTAWGCER